MKFMEKLRAVPRKTWLIAGIATACALTLLVVCLFLLPDGKKPVGGQVAGDTVAVTVQNRAGTPIKNVQVYVYEDKSMTELVTFAKTDADGKMSFVGGGNGQVVALKGVAPGYKLEAYYPLTGAETTIVLDALATTPDGKLPSDVKYRVGDPVMDFTVTDVDGNSYTASEVLKEKNALVLNFWYTACQPCQMEFPYLQAAYEQYKDSVLVLAMDPYTADTADAIKEFRDANGLTMPVASADPAWVSVMNVLAYPTTVVIDRYGIITFFHTGAITEEGVFEKLFAFYGAAEYNQAITDDLDELDEVIAQAQNPDSDSTTGDAANGGAGETTTGTGLRTEFMGVLGTKKEPLEVGSTLTFTTEIPAGKESYFNVFRVSGTIFTLYCNNGVSVEYEGKVYTPQGGKIEFPVKSDDVTIPIQLILRNDGTATEKLVVNFIYPRGTLANPFDLTMGLLTTDIEKGNDQGVVYTYTATEHGILEMYPVSATNGVDYDFTLYNLTSYANRTLKEDGSGEKVSVNVNKGETVQVTVSVLPNSEHEYPAAVIQSNLVFVVTGTEVTKPTDPTTATFSVTVEDEYGAKVPDIEMTFDVDGTVQKVLTNADGVATVTMPYGNCKATITVPEFFMVDRLTHLLTPEAPTVTIVLKEDNWFDDPEPEPGDSTTESSGSTTESTGSTTESDSTATGSTGSTTGSTGTTTGNGGTTEPTDPTGSTGTTGTTTKPTTKPTTQPTESTAEYTVKVVNIDGEPQAGVTVKILSGNTAVVTQKADADGIVKAVLDRGNYRVTITGTTLKYDARAAVLTATKTNLEVLLAPMFSTADKGTITCPLLEEEVNAYKLTAGATYVQLTGGARNYFLFEPTETGTYRFTTTNSSAVIGYYGSPYYVFTQHTVPDRVDNAFELSVSEVGPTYLIGVDVPSNITSTVVSIVRVGDAQWSPTQEPWQLYTGTHTPTKFTLPAGITLENVDITAANQEVVYNEQDGYYHLNDANGPIVYVRFSGSSYINLNDLVANQRVGIYIYDADGNFVSKEQYNDYLFTYYYLPNPMYDPTGVPVNMLDASMVYPLNDDLKYILQSYAAHQKWGDIESPNYLFKDADGEPITGINGDLAWMFALCYGVK